jgi:hypothetical protein
LTLRVCSSKTGTCASIESPTVPTQALPSSAVVGVSRVDPIWAGSGEAITIRRRSTIST